MKKKKLALGIVVLALLAAVSGGLFFARVVRENITPAEPIAWGVTFSKKQAAFLGLDWKKTYSAILDDLGVRHLRVAADWDELEPRAGHFDWRDLDWMLAEAEKRGVWASATVVA